MNIRNLFFIITLALSTSSQVHGMEPEFSIKRCAGSGCGPLSFVVKTEKLNLLFRQVLLSNLAMEEKSEDFLTIGNEHNADDRATLMEALGDFDAMESTYGTPLACVGKIFHACSPETYLETFLNGFEAILEKMPDDKKVLYFWFIQDLNLNREFVGRALVRTFTQAIPEEYADTHLLDIGLTLTKNYRRKGIGSALTEHMLEYLITLDPFKNYTLCFDTLADNIATHKIATKVNAKLIARRDKPVDCRFPWYTIPCDLFIIPRR